MRYFLRVVHYANWTGGPADDASQTAARGDFRLREGDDDGLSIYEVTSSLEDDHRLVVAAVACARPFVKGGTKLDDDKVDLLLFTDEDATDLGSIPSSGTSDSCILPVRDAHRAIDWPQVQLDALAGRLLDRRRVARRFKAAEVQEILLGLRREQVDSDQVWNYIESQRAAWTARLRTEAEKRAKREKQEIATKERESRRRAADQQKENDLVALVQAIAWEFVPDRAEAVIRATLAALLDDTE